MNTILKKGVVIIEDDEDIRKSFTLLINGSQHFIVKGAYTSCEDCLKNLSTDKPDIVLMDIQLPGMSGIAGTQIIKERSPLTEVVILTVYEEGELIFEALKAGASGYLTKGTNYGELFNALNEISNGGAPMSSRIARMVIEAFHLNPNSPLSRRETEILRLISEGKTYTQISDELFISKETSKTHIRNIYSKLQVTSKSDAIAKAIQERLI